MRNALMLLSFLMIISSCSKVPIAIVPEVNPITDTLLFTEQFESPAKNNYNNTLLNLQTGQWIIANAMLGTSINDKKNGSQSVRIIGNGSASMAYTVNLGSETTIKLNVSKYGNSADGKWYLLASNNGGAYEKIGETITTTASSLTSTEIKYTKKGWTSFAIQKVEDGGILNFDDFSITTKTPDYNVNYIAAPPYINNYTFGPGTSLPPVTNPDFIVMGAVGADSSLYPLSGDNSSLLLGNPSNAIQNTTTSANNYLLVSRYYAASYNRDKATPNWVSWHLDKSNYGAVSREDNYTTNTFLPSDWYRVAATDYGTSYTRGHNCPSGDRTSSREANNSVFLMTNMIPQTSANNNGVWNNFESYCRSLTDAGNECYIIMGSYGNATTINSGKITVPTNVWKVVVVLPNGNNDASRINASTRVIAINTPNTNNSNDDWKTYRTSIKAIEDASGYKLLSALPATVKDALVNKIDNQ